MLLALKKTESVLLYLQKSLFRKPVSEIRNQLILKVQMCLEKLYFHHDIVTFKKLPSVKSSIREWIVSGPYLHFGKSDLNYIFKPEIVSLHMSGNGFKRIKTYEPHGFVSLSEYFNKHRGYAYCATTIVKAEPFQIYIQSSGFYIVFINGKKVLINDKNNFSSKRRIYVEPSGGKTTIMVKYSLYEKKEIPNTNA
jgi:hypothetical protein